MSVIKLSRTQVMVVRTMGRQLTSLEKSLDKINAKEAKFMADIATEKTVVTDAMDKINESIITYTGGVTLNEVLNPSSSVGAVDPTATVDETAAPTETDITDELRYAVPAESAPEPFSAQTQANLENEAANTTVDQDAELAPEPGAAFWEGAVK